MANLLPGEVRSLLKDGTFFNVGGALRAATCLALLPLAATAGFIQLRLDAETTTSSTPPALTVSVSNTGDNPARNVSINATLESWSASTPPIRTIAPGATHTVALPITTPPTQPGNYTTILKARYTDDNNVSFSAITTAEASFPGDVRRIGEHLLPPADWIVPLLSAQSHTNGATLSLRLMSLTAAPESIHLRLILPDELRCAESSRQLTLPPDTETTETFELDTRHAQPGSTYTVWAILDNESQGQHQTASTSTIVRIEATPTTPPPWQYLLWLSAITTIPIILLRRGRTSRDASSRQPNPLLDAAILLGLTAFLLWHLAPLDLLRNTTTVGGDTPAHNYMASHLREQLLHHGRIISWAGGWWGGLPLFQYYFPLPYLLIAALSFIIPFNIAFKLVSVLGILALPASTYTATRLLRLPRPAPIVAAILMVPFLFVHEHTMWGVNIASTLAGMIANSLSFALMLPAIASVWRDTEDGCLRLRSVFLLTLVMASHFFTSVMAVLALTLAPLMILRVHRTASARRQALAVLLAEGALALLLMAWWLVPLFAKSAYSMDFGTNWTMTLWKNFPPWAAGLLPLAVVAILFPLRPSRLLLNSSSEFHSHSIWLFAWMLATALFLFQFGYRLSPVFVNCRLWPFLMFALTMLGAIGLGLLLQPARRQTMAVLTSTVLILSAVAWNEQRPDNLHRRNLMRTWAQWNFRGLELKPSAAVFKNLVLPLRGTPGRLANDLHDDNNRLGSSRIFELAPHLAAKPILEGGLVNSALGSMFAYYIQSETSDTCAGAPPIVKTASFNMDIATRHLELFNVKHFIARSPATQLALRTDPRWKFIQREEQWELFELLTHNGSYVVIPKFLPAVLETANPNQSGMDWIYVPGALDQPFILTNPRTTPLPATLPRVTESQFHDFLRAAATATGGVVAAWQVPIPHSAGTSVSAETVSDSAIRFHTTAIGQPHIVKISYFPNWQARGADTVFRVTPAFLLVFPRREQVELFYGSTSADSIGRWLTVLGWLLIGLLGWRIRGTH